MLSLKKAEKQFDNCKAGTKFLAAVTFIENLSQNCNTKIKFKNFLENLLKSIRGDGGRKVF